MSKYGFMPRACCLAALGVAAGARADDDAASWRRPRPISRPSPRPSPTGTARPPGRRRRQETGRLCLDRPAQRRRAGRRRRRGGGRQGARLGVPHPRRPGLRSRRALGDDPGDRAEARRHHPRRRRRQGAAARGRAGGGGRASRSSAGTRARRPARSMAFRRCSTNVTTDPLEVAKASGLYAVVKSDGKAGVILFTDSIYAIATAKTNAEKAAIEGCTGCKVLSVEDTPIGDLANRMGQLTTSLLSKYGKAWTYSIAVNDLYFDFSAPALTSAGIDPGDRLSAADLRRRRLGAGVPAHPREAVSDRHRRRAAAPAGLAAGRRNEPRLRRREAERLRAAGASVHARQHRQGRRRAEHLRSRQRLQGRSTRRSGA